MNVRFLESPSPVSILDRQGSYLAIRNVLPLPGSKLRRSTGTGWTSIKMFFTLLASVPTDFARTFHSILDEFQSPFGVTFPMLRSYFLILSKDIRYPVDTIVWINATNVKHNFFICILTVEITARLLYRSLVVNFPRNKRVHSRQLINICGNRKGNVARMIHNGRPCKNFREKVVLPDRTFSAYTWYRWSPWKFHYVVHVDLM